MLGPRELIHAERRNDYGVGSAVRVYRCASGELMITERFDAPAGPFSGSNLTVVSAEGVQAILDHFRPPPETETHGNPDLDATLEARRAALRHGVG